MLTLTAQRPKPENNPIITNAGIKSDHDAAAVAVKKRRITPIKASFAHGALGNPNHGSKKDTRDDKPAANVDWSEKLNH